MLTLDKLSSLEKLSRLFSNGEANANEIKELSELIQDINNDQPASASLNQSQKVSTSNNIV